MSILQSLLKRIFCEFYGAGGVGTIMKFRKFYFVKIEKVLGNEHYTQVLDLN